MTRYYPALIILIGPLSAEIQARTEELIRERLGVSATPDIFQFVEGKPDRIDNEIRDYYHAALSKRTASETQDALAGTVDGSRIETFVVAPLEPDSLNLAKLCAKVVDKCARETVAGGRNAIFLASRGLLSLTDASRHQAAQTLDLAMCESVFPFSRCFFVDDVNEIGQTVTSRADLVDLVANFISLSIASDLCDVLQSNPPPYDGSRGLQHKAYASFSCNTIGFNKSVLIDELTHLLASDIAGHLVSDRRIKNEHADLVAESVDWFHDDRRALEQELRKRNNDGPQNGEALPQSVIAAASLAAERRLDQFLDRTCEMLKHDFGELRDFLDLVLDQWLVALEQMAEEIKRKKIKIADLSIKSLVGIPYTVVYKEEIVEQPRWWQLFRKPQTRTINRTQSLDPGMVLAEARREHSILTRILEIKIALYNRLDGLCLNLDRLKQSLERPTLIESQSIFNVDLVNDNLAQQYYSSAEYQDKDAHITQFIYSPEFNRFRTELSSYPAGVPEVYLFHYCKRCFQFIESLTVEKICALKRLFKDHRGLLYFSPPFWKPVSLATGERLAIILSREEAKLDLRNVVDIRTSPINEIYVNSNDSNNITLIQMTYGLKLADFISFADHGDAIPAAAEHSFV